MIRATIALLASLLAAVQAIFIYLTGETICFNSGCSIVDSLTTVPPLYFNIAGFVFFQTLFWCLRWGRDGSEFWHKLAGLFLLAGLCAEAVLVFFQYSIATVFCSYCMVILAFIVLLNVLSGPRQIFRGVVLFSVVTVACFSLQFRATTYSGESLDTGSIAMVTGEHKEPKLYLFFSSTCAHCENVIEALKGKNNCTVHFNPIERIEGFTYPGAEFFSKYNVEINLNFMKSLSIKEIPVLVSIEPQNIRVLKGEQRIRDYLDETCTTKVIDYSGTSSMVPKQYPITSGEGKQADDACPVVGDCDTESSGAAADKK